MMLFNDVNLCVFFPDIIRFLFDFQVKICYNSHMKTPISYNELPTPREIRHAESSNIFDFTIYESGWEITLPFTYYIIHFIVDGKGFYEINDKVYSVKKNQLFLIPPNIPTRYYSDKQNPWRYLWIGFSTQNDKELLKFCGFEKNGVVLNFPSMDLIKNYAHLLNTYKKHNLAYEQLLFGLLYQSVGILIAKNSNVKQITPVDTYVNAAIKFIKKNFRSKITVTDIAQYVGLERTYFSKIFSSKTKVSPKEYLQNLRLSLATKMLSESTMSSYEIALSLGFNDYSHFYKAFLKKYKITPNDYKQKIPPTSK